MTTDAVISIGREALITILMVSAPVLVISVVSGLIVSVFQATTQIHDQTLSFVPKILSVLLALFLFGGWMLGRLAEFARSFMDKVAHLG